MPTFLAGLRWRVVLVALPVVGAFILGVGTPLAQADLPKKVLAAFKGKILVTEGPLEPGANDKATIAQFKKIALPAVTGAPNGEEATEWRFHYTAFLKARGATTLKLEFHDGKKYVGDKTLNEIDPASPVLEGDIVIDENEGPTKGKTYTLKLVKTVGKKDVVLATSSLSLK